eukprot:Rhum_TRINITY_DN265_c0_g2::Rhum_TRINITY_DN265_c0_g2_i1::g.934::m.934
MGGVRRRKGRVRGGILCRYILIGCRGCGCVGVAGEWGRHFICICILLFLNFALTSFFVSLLVVRVGVRRRLADVRVDVVPVAVAEGLKVPVDRALQTLVEVHLLRPPEVAELRRVDDVAEVVEVTVRDARHPVLHLVLWLHQPHQLRRDVLHRDLVLRADVVDLTQVPALHHARVRTRHVVCVHKGAHLVARALDGHLLVLGQQPDEARDDLLRVLARAVHVVAAGDDDGQVEGLAVRLDDELGGGLRRSVGVGRVEHRVLELLVLDLAVDFVGGDVDELLQLAVHLRALEQVVRAQHVGLGEVHGVAEGVVDVRLGGEVDQGVDVVALQQVHHEVGARDVALDERVVARQLLLRHVLLVRTVVHDVQVVDLALRVPRSEVVDEVRPDEAAPARHQHVLHRPRALAGTRVFLRSLDCVRHVGGGRRGGGGGGGGTKGSGFVLANCTLLGLFLLLLSMKYRYCSF